jgi:hypothetical protein
LSSAQTKAKRILYDSVYCDPHYDKITQPRAHIANSDAHDYHGRSLKISHGEDAVDAHESPGKFAISVKPLKSSLTPLTTE